MLQPSLLLVQPLQYTLSLSPSLVFPRRVVDNSGTPKCRLVQTQFRFDRKSTGMTKDGGLFELNRVAT